MIHVAWWIITDKDENLIMVKNRQGFWVLPGWKVDPWETPIVSLQREVSEELNGLVLPLNEIEEYKLFWPMQSPIGENIAIHTFKLPNVNVEKLKISNEIRAIWKHNLSEAMSLIDIKFATQMIVTDLIFDPIYRNWWNNWEPTVEDYMNFYRLGIETLSHININDAFPPDELNKKKNR